ncbi:MAG: hypothetical protein PGN09_14470, partial [Sphingomonas fennica]
GTYTLSRDTKDAPTAPTIDRLKNGVNRFNFIGTLGAEVGPVSGRVQWTHSGGYPILGDPVQPRVRHSTPSIPSSRSISKSWA